jgi:hypothetical protein
MYVGFSNLDIYPLGVTLCDSSRYSPWIDLRLPVFILSYVLPEGKSGHIEPSRWDLTVVPSRHVVKDVYVCTSTIVSQNIHEMV